MSESNHGKETNKQSRLSESTADLVDAAFGTYFQLRETPLPGWARFFCAWLGAGTLFVSGFFFCIGPAGWIAEGCNIGTNIHGSVKPSTLGLIAVIGGPILFGGLIAAANTKHGPVRLYLFGLLLATFVITVVFNALAGTK